MPDRLLELHVLRLVLRRHSIQRRPLRQYRPHRSYRLQNPNDAQYSGRDNPYWASQIDVPQISGQKRGGKDRIYRGVENQPQCFSQIHLLNDTQWPSEGSAVFSRDFDLSDEQERGGTAIEIVARRGLGDSSWGSTRGTDCIEVVHFGGQVRIARFLLGKLRVGRNRRTEFSIAGQTKRPRMAVLRKVINNSDISICLWVNEQTDVWFEWMSRPLFDVWEWIKLTNERLQRIRDSAAGTQI